MWAQRGLAVAFRVYVQSGCGRLFLVGAGLSEQVPTARAFATQAPTSSTVVAGAKKASPGAKKRAVRVDYASLQTFSDLYGHLRVPTRFAFEGPGLLAQGFAASYLGRHVSYIRQSGQSGHDASVTARLADMGFSWDSNRTQAFKRILLALTTYEQLHGDFIVPQHFIVPDCESWERHLWGLRLGFNFNNIRCRELTPTQHAALLQIGISLEDFSSIHDIKFSRIVRTLETYRQIHGHLVIPTNFRVPRQEPWGREMWGLRLGDKFKKLRLHSSEKQRKTLDEMQITLQPLREQLGEQIVQALMVYTQLHGHKSGPGGWAGYRMRVGGETTHDTGNETGKGAGKGTGTGTVTEKGIGTVHGNRMFVPLNFVVPAREPWPRVLWNLRLGNRVNAIRSKGTYPLYHTQFQEMGIL